MTFQDRKKVGRDWDKVKTKREIMHPKNTVSANVPNGVIAQTIPKTDTEPKTNKK